MKKYIEMIRVKHWIKNFLIFLPLIFSSNIFDLNKVLITLIAFISFSLVASTIYIINDIKDIEKDKLHPVKKNRAIASGRVSIKNANIAKYILIVAGILIGSINILFIKNIHTILMFFGLVLSYFLINLAYSSGLKNKPIIDVIILVYGFVVRVFIGSVICNIELSNFMYLTVMTGSFFMGFGKRRNEILKVSGNETREVLGKYNKDFLDKFMYSSLTLAIVFYSLWCMDIKTIEKIGNNLMIWTVPVIIVILMKYSYNIETDGYGDPVDVILSDKILLVLILIYMAFMGSIIYLF